MHFSTIRLNPKSSEYLTRKSRVLQILVALSLFTTTASTLQHQSPKEACSNPDQQQEPRIMKDFEKANMDEMDLNPNLPSPSSPSNSDTSPTPLANNNNNNNNNKRARQDGPPTGMAFGLIQGLNKPISRVIYGTLFLHSVDDPFALLDSVYATGCNAFDAAAIYANGKCESIMGEWLKQRPDLRERLVLITKGGCHGQDKLWSADISPNHVRTGLLESLKRLGTSYVDVFLLHRDDENVPVSDVVDMMHDLSIEGYFTVWGVSNWELTRLKAAIEYAKSVGKMAPTCDSLQMSLAQPEHPVWPDTKFMKPESRFWYEANGISVLAWEVLAKGFMTGKWDRIDGDRAHAMQHTDTGRRRSSELSPTGETADEWREMKLITAYCVKSNFDRRDRAQQLADKKAMTMGQVALQYIASQPFQSFALVGTRSPKNFAENAKGGSTESKLTSKEIQWLETGDN